MEIENKIRLRFIHMIRHRKIKCF